MHLHTCIFIEFKYLVGKKLGKNTRLASYEEIAILEKRFKTKGKIKQWYQSKSEWLLSSDSLCPLQRFWKVTLCWRDITINQGISLPGLTWRWCLKLSEQIPQSVNMLVWFDFSHLKESKMRQNGANCNEFLIYCISDFLKWEPVCFVCPVK